MVMLMIGLFACAAVAGVILAALHFAGKKLPMALALLHGLFAVAAVIVLIMAVMKLATAGLLGIALIIFALAALGGLGLFLGFYLPRKKLPSAGVVLHGLLAVSGFVIVLVFTLSH
jgi:hypothetical protein